MRKRSNTLFIALGFALAAGVIAITAPASEDVTAPAATAVSYTPVSISTTSGAQSITVTIAATDALSGVAKGSLYFQSPNNVQAAVAGFSAANLTGGTANSGTWTVTVSFPQYANVGGWKLRNMVVWDAVGNWSSYAQGNAIFGTYSSVYTN